MKRILAMTAVVLLGLGLATPVLADHGGYYRGHSGRIVARGGYHSGFYAPRPRFRTSLSFGFGLPFFGYGVYAAPPPYYYGPAPVALGPGYCRPYWVPGHYVYGGGAGIRVAGYWGP